ncbi:MAG: PAS domain S-box protein [Candidatus Alcyoniella australis]|nr:PAS domain S-box protein [Candidatus Alcyoniella australis]
MSKQDRDELLKRIAQLEDEKKLLEQLCEESAQRFSQQQRIIDTVLQSIPNPLMIIDVEQYTVVGANPAANCEVNSRLKTCFNICHHRDEPCGLGGENCPVDMVKQSGEPVVVEHEHYTSQGERREAEIHVFPIKDDQGRVVQVIQYCLDITASKTARLEAEQARAFLMEVINAAPSTIYVKDQDGRYLLVNREMAKLFGMTSEVMTGMTDASFANLSNNSLEQAEKFRADDLEVIQSKQPKFVAEESFTRPDGVVRHFQTYKIPIMLDQNPDCVLGISTDITEHKQAQVEATEGQRRFKGLFDNLNSSVLIYEAVDEGRNFVIRDINQAGLEVSNKSLDQIVDKLVSDVYPGLEASGLVDLFRKVWLSGEPMRQPLFKYEDDRLTLWVASYIYKLPSGEIVAIFDDLTERKLAEDQQRSDYVFLQTLIDTISSPIFYKDAKGIYTGCNAAFEQYIGLTREKIVGSTVYDIAPRELAEVYQRADDNLLKAGGSQQYEAQVRYADGTLHDVIFNKAVFKRAEGEPDGIIGVIIDITERKLAEERLRQGEKRFRELAEMLPQIVFELDTEGRLTFVNQQMYQFTDLTPEQVERGFNGLELVVPDDIELATRILSDLLSGGHMAPQEFEIRGRNGRPLPVLAYATAVEHNGQITGLRCILLDIRDSKRQQQRLAESEERFRTLFEMAPDAYYISELDGTLIDGNLAAEKLIGYPREQLIGSNFLELGLLASEDIPCAAELLYKNNQGLGTGPDELTLKSGDGRRLTVEIHTRPAKIGERTLVLGLARDITARKLIEQQMQQQQKMESIGTLASGVAHEINNPLHVIVNYSELIAERKCVDPERTAEYARIVVQECDRAARIVQGLMRFARQQPEEITPTPIAELVEQTACLFRGMLKNDQIDLELDVPDGLPLVPCRTQQIQQALLGLVNNARDSLNAKYGDQTEVKRVSVSVRPLERDGASWVRIAVRDNGEGVDPSLSERIFEPFFTSRDRSSSSGLGLAVGYNIMQDHGGELSFDSEPGVYAEFRLDLKAQ